MNQAESAELSALGFTPFFQGQHTQQQHDGSLGEPARVTRVTAHVCELATERGPLRAHVPKRLRKRRPPVVGDWVWYRLGAGDAPLTEVRLTGVFERRSEIARGAAGRRTRVQLIAANVDVLFVVTGLDGDFNPRRIERYLALAAQSHVEAVVLLTKAGICDDTNSKLAAAEAVSGRAPVHAVDVLAGINTAALEAYLVPGQTVALVGSSGAGKSTLVNHWLGETQMAVGEVRASDDRGCHTTTHRELLWLPGGAALIDNPGMRELQLWIDRDALDETFGEVSAAAAGCRFGDCTHLHEPGCAVRRAVDDGDVAPDRLDSYLKLQVEVETTKRRRDEHQRRGDERALSKMIRATQRRKR